MARGELNGMTMFQFKTPEDHKQMVLALVGEGVSMADVTRAFGRIFLTDAKFRQKVINTARQLRVANKNQGA